MAEQSIASQMFLEHDGRLIDEDMVFPSSNMERAVEVNSNLTADGDLRISMSDLSGESSSIAKGAGVDS